MTRAAWYFALAGLAVVYGIYAIATVDRTDDRQQITALIRHAVESVQERDVGGAISCVSKKYKDENGLNYDRLRLLAAQALRIETRYTVTADPRDLRIEGDRAIVRLRAVVKDSNGDELYKRDLTLILRKEPARHMLLIPTRVWRVTGTRNLGLSY